jgi:uncharacterized protein YlzI (FlbEa/FlbD family)
LIVLHRVDGGEVAINPAHVTSLMAAADRSKIVTPGVHCVVGLTDGKYVFVTESCAQVRSKLEENVR